MVNTEMEQQNRRTCGRRAVTLVELVVAVSVMTAILAAMLPLLVGIRNSWESKEASAEMLQNGRVLVNHMHRNLSKALRITDVSDANETSGYVEFENSNGVGLRYDVSATNAYVEFGLIGDLSDLAGPVSTLQFTCYDANDFSNPTTDVNSIRFVQIQACLTSSNPMRGDQTFTTSAYVRSNGDATSCWEDQDIGSVGAEGSAGWADNTWTVEASGEDIWGRGDEFHFVYLPLSGNGQIIARVASLENTDSWAKAGVMIRETLLPNARHAMMVVTPDNGTAFQRRTWVGGMSDHTAGSSVQAPYWVKLIRAGTTFVGYESADGQSWTQVGSDTISMDDDVYIGLAVTSHHDGTLCTAEIDNVSIIYTSGDAAIPETTSPPTIDGSVDSAWGNATPYSIENVVVGAVHGSQDFSGTWRALWDSSNIYYLVEITDNSLKNNSGSSWWDDDCVEIMIDADNSGGSTYDGINDFQYGFRWNDSTVHVGSYSVDDTTGVNFAIVDTSDGYCLEASIPWSTLGVTPSEGHVIGAEIYVDDDDNHGGRDAQVSWHTSSPDAWRDPSLFGHAELTNSAGGSAQGGGGGGGLAP